MLANQTLRKIQLLTLRKEAQIIEAIQSALTGVDPNAQLLPLEKALVSRTVNKELWEALPNENQAYQYNSVQELMREGRQFLQDELQAPIILHLGWDMLAFVTTLKAACVRR